MCIKNDVSFYTHAIDFIKNAYRMVITNDLASKNVALSRIFLCLVEQNRCVLRIFCLPLLRIIRQYHATSI